MTHSTYERTPVAPVVADGNYRPTALGSPVERGYHLFVRWLHAWGAIVSMGFTM
jgi:hypothetical protein